MNRRKFLLTAFETRPADISKERLHELQLYNATVTKFALASNKFNGVKMQQLEDYINKLIDMPGVTEQEAGTLVHCYHIATVVAEART